MEAEEGVVVFSKIFEGGKDPCSGVADEGLVDGVGAEDRAEEVGFSTGSVEGLGLTVLDALGTTGFAEVGREMMFAAAGFVIEAVAFTDGEDPEDGLVEEFAVVVVALDPLAFVTLEDA